MEVRIRSGLGRITRSHLGYVLVAVVCIVAFAIARMNEAFLAATLLLVLNLEIVRRTDLDGSMAEYLNTVLFHVAFFFLAPSYYFDLLPPPVNRFDSEIQFAVEALVVVLLNMRYQFVSLRALSHFLALAVIVCLPFEIWRLIWVPHGRVHGFSIALEVYRYWMMPVEMMLIAGPFFVTALAMDFGSKGNGSQAVMADVYYLYALPLMAFGLFPGVGISLQANCDLNSTYVAIGGIVVLILAGLVLSLFTHRKSIVLASALAALPLGVNRCVTAPVFEAILIVCGILLLTWRWLPKGPGRGA